MIQTIDAPCLSTSQLNRQNIKKRQLKIHVIDDITRCTADTLTRWMYCDPRLQCFFVLLMLQLSSSTGSSYAAFLPPHQRIKNNELLFQCHGAPQLSTCHKQLPPFVKRTIIRGPLSVQKSPDESMEVISSNVTATSSTNQSVMPLADHTSHSNPLLVQQLQQPTPQRQPLQGGIFSTPTSDGSAPVSFGDVVSRKEKPLLYESEQVQMLDSTTPSTTTTTTTTTDTASFGDVVSMKRPASSTLPAVSVTPMSSVAGTTISEERKVANQIRFRNAVVAVLSISVAIGNFIFQYLHPVEPIQILFDLQQSSADISVVGKNHKPTIIDFWAPWCENCKLSAATLQSIEKQYGNDVNFILINGDLSTSWPYIEALGVDAIPHMSMISYDGVVETALIGPIPKHIIQDDIEVLLLNSRNNAEAIRTSRTTDGGVPNESTDGRDMNQQQSEHIELPHKMLDVFAGKSESARRVQF